MVEIISKRSGPRREDVEARRMIERNRGTIEKLADQISGGGYTAARQRAAQAKIGPQASGLIFSDLGAGKKSEVPQPYVRISLNKRVVVIDYETSRQLHYLGEIRRIDGAFRFVVATKKNGFFSSLEPDLAATLAPLDGAPMGGPRTDAALAAELGALLGYAPI